MKANKYHIKPNQEQIEKLSIQFGHARFIHNYMLSIKSDAYNEYGVNVSRYSLQSMLPAMKRENMYSWLKDAHSQVLQSALLHLDTAFKNFFAKRAKFPKFKSKYGKQSCQYPQGVKIEDNKIFIPKVGWVKAVIHREVLGKIKTVTISKDATGKYYASVLIDDGFIAPKLKTHIDKVIGVDMGIALFATTSDKTTVKNPRFYERQLKSLKRKQQSLSRKTKGSNRYAKARIRVAKAHKKVSDARNDFQHKISKQLANNNHAVILERLNIKGMSRSRLAKQMHDIGWTSFVEKLAYKLKDRGHHLVKVNPAYTSQECSCCGHTEKNNRKTQDKFECLACEHKANADHNASINIKNRGVIELKADGNTVSARGGSVRLASISQQFPVKREALFIALA